MMAHPVPYPKTVCWDVYWDSRPFVYKFKKKKIKNKHIHVNMYICYINICIYANNCL